MLALATAATLGAVELRQVWRRGSARSLGQSGQRALAGRAVAVDGFFHLATWIFVAVGSWLMLRAWQEGRLAPPWRVHLGLLLAGWGIFNVVEGLIDHEILGIHHVRDDLGGPIGWDLGFLALGALLIVGGFAMARHPAPTARRRSTRRAQGPAAPRPR